MRRSLVLATLVLGSKAPACMWDSDTLAEEASLGKDFISAIVGRFPRNPPLYFAMRRDRILAKRTKTLDDYDDLAVAFDRLGDPIAALRWIDRKPPGNTEVEYRTHANRGTFFIHGWLKGKLDKKAGERGVQELERAVAINPNAHFGRERVQIRLINEFLYPSDFFEADEDPLKSAEGYAGIVRLGSGWESPDVFRVMAIDLARVSESKQRLGAVASLALLRADELVKTGAKARLRDDMDFQMIEGVQGKPLESETREQFVRLRREADAWHTRRTAFMTARLKAGLHPDTDPTFWQGWSDGTPPKIEDGWTTRTFGAPIPWYFVLLGTLILATVVSIPTALAFFVARTVWSGIKRRRRA